MSHIDIDRIDLEDCEFVLNWLTQEIDQIGLESTIEFALRTITQLKYGKPNPVAVPKGNWEMIRRVMQTARENGIEWPKLHLGTSYNITLAYNKKGQINITNGEKYGHSDNVWYGRINDAVQNYTLYQPNANGKRLNDAIADILLEFNNNPPAFAKIYSQETGQCMFCRRKLTNPQSVVVGYGPICADNFGLPWGDVEMACEAVQTELQVSTHD